MINKRYKTIIILARIGAFVLAVLPHVGMRNEGEAMSGILLIRGI